MNMKVRDALPASEIVTERRLEQLLLNAGAYEDYTTYELERVLPLVNSRGESAAEFTSLSSETLEDHYPSLIVRLSERRKGLKFKHCLAITLQTRRAPAPA